MLLKTHPSRAVIFLVLTATFTEAPFAAGKWNRLYSESAESSSFLQNNWNKYQENYHPAYILDDDPKTAWVEGADGNGEGETLQYRVSALSSANAVKLRIRNGYQKSKHLWRANSAPEEVLISLHGAGGTVVTSKQFVLKQQWGWQEVQLPVPSGRGFSAISLKVVSVYPGTVYKDTCISDIQTFVDSSVSYNKPVELGKHKRLKNWIEDRIQTAKYFTKEKQQYSFASTHFEATSNLPSKSEMLSLHKQFQSQLESIMAQDGWYRGTSRKNLEALPDGLGNSSFYTLEQTRHLFDAKELSLFEANKAIRKHTVSDQYQGVTFAENWVSNYKPSWYQSKAKKLKALHFWYKVAGQERVSYENRTDYLLNYDEAGRLIFVYSLTNSKEEWMEEGQSFAHAVLVLFHYNESGRIHRVDKSWVSFSPEQAPVEKNLVVVSYVPKA